VINELSRILKEVNQDKTSQFNFLVTALLEGCKSSMAHILPPINWYYLITSLMKSKYGNGMESELIELSLMQISHLFSAYSLLKNYLVDTNFFFNLKVKLSVYYLQLLQLT
jgi:hypothetical protein